MEYRLVYRYGVYCLENKVGKGIFKRWSVIGVYYNLEEAEENYTFCLQHGDFIKAYDNLK